MHNTKKIFVFFFLISLIINTQAYAKTAFLDLDFVFQNSNLGKKISDKLEKLKSKNLELLKNRETEFMKEENELKKIKNLISEDEFKKKLNELSDKLNQYKVEKKTIGSDFNKIKNDELKLFFQQINPIIQEYMNNKNINLLLEKKNIFIGKAENDITSDILNAVNNEFK